MANELTFDVKTSTGSLRGFTVKGAASTLFGFYGIPYAEAPVGELRWKDAVTKSPWNGILDCAAPLTEQKSAYQWGTNLLSYFRTLNVSEDCLHLNITTPSLEKDAALPVLVWFHGGGLFGGSGSEEVYNLPELPQKGCVLVTVSTRLGAFGLLAADVLGSTHGTPHSGNFIISDMLEALNWVKKNIAQFGGNPENVTIAGESGGAHKVCALLTVPQAKGLFSRAIMQSGIASAVDYAAAKSMGNAIFEKLGVTTPEKARALPAEALLQAYNELGLMSDFIVDGFYLPTAPFDGILTGKYHRCDVIMGVNSGEIDNLLMLIGSIPKYIAVLERLTADGQRAYVYELDQVPDVWRCLGFKCVHSMDIAYLFGEYEDTHRYYNGGPWEQQFMFHNAGERLSVGSFISPTMDDDDRSVSELMMNAWVSFAKKGDPENGWKLWTHEKQNYLYLSAMNGNMPHMKTDFFKLSPPEPERK